MTARTSAPWREGAPTLAALEAAKGAHVTAIVDHVIAAVTRSRAVLGPYYLQVEVEWAPMPDDETGQVPQIVVARVGQGHWDALDTLGPDTFAEYGDVVGDGLEMLFDDAIGALRDVGLDLGDVTVALRPAVDVAALGS